MAAYDSQVIDRVMPKIKQYEATTGRRLSPKMLESLMAAELDVESKNATDNAFRSKSLELSERGLALNEKQAKDQAASAKVGGITGLASTAATGYLGYQYLNKPSPMAEYLASMKGSGTAVGGAGVESVPALSAPGNLSGSLAGQTPGLTGAQTSLGGGGAAATGGGVQGALGATEAVTPAVTAGVADAAATTSATAAGEVGLGTIASGLGYGGLAKVGTSMLGANQEISNTAGGAVAGAMIGAEYGSIGGPVGAVVGAVVGLVAGEIVDTVLCTELHRQGEISERELKWARVCRMRYVSHNIYTGYLAWGTPVANTMRTNSTFNRMFKPVAKCFLRGLVRIAKGESLTASQWLACKSAYLLSYIAYHYTKCCSHVVAEVR
jgi:hypothetical protein